MAEDKNAYFSYEPLVNVGINITEGELTEVIEFHNQFDAELDTVEVDVSAINTSGATIKTFDTPDQLNPGSAGIVTPNFETQQNNVLGECIAVFGELRRVSRDGLVYQMDRLLSKTEDL